MSCGRLTNLVTYRVQGYAVFLDGKWSVPTFIFNYGIVSNSVPNRTAVQIQELMLILH